MKLHAFAFAVLAFLAVTACGGSSASPANSYLPPSGGEKFESTGVLFVLESPSWPIEKARRIRDLSEIETKALRQFLESSEYQQFTVLHADHANVPVVRIDGVHWWVYRSSMYRVKDGDSHWRKTIDNVHLSSEERSDEIDFKSLTSWYEAAK